jgi:hypothetical protein
MISPYRIANIFSLNIFAAFTSQLTRRKPIRLEKRRQKKRGRLTAVPMLDFKILLASIYIVSYRGFPP